MESSEWKSYNVGLARSNQISNGKLCDNPHMDIELSIYNAR